MPIKTQTPLAAPCAEILLCYENRAQRMPDLKTRKKFPTCAGPFLLRRAEKCLNSHKPRSSSSRRPSPLAMKKTPLDVKFVCLHKSSEIKFLLYVDRTRHTSSIMRLEQEEMFRCCSLEYWKIVMTICKTIIGISSLSMQRSF